VGIPVETASALRFFRRRPADRRRYIPDRAQAIQLVQLTRSRNRGLVSRVNFRLKKSPGAGSTGALCGSPGFGGGRPTFGRYCRAASLGGKALPVHNEGRTTCLPCPDGRHCRMLDCSVCVRPAPPSSSPAYPPKPRNRLSDLDGFTSKPTSTPGHQRRWAAPCIADLTRRNGPHGPS
jgi:hypothetical protein